MLDGIHAVITGGASGIGAAIADRLAAQGASLTLIGRTTARLEKKCAELGKTHKREFFQVTADISLEEQVNAAFAAASSKFGDPLILINSAGIAESAPFLKTDAALWKKITGTDLDGVFYCTRAALPGMINAGFGRIVNIASTAGISGYQYVTAYCAAKHGVVGLTRALALEMTGKGITVNAVCPGFTETDILSSSIERAANKTGRSPAQIRKELQSLSPQGRFIQPSEVASAAAWLCEKENGSVTGQALVVDGGELL